MKLTYISRIQSNIKKYRVIKSNVASSNIIDGSYNSVFKGRSMNFDELREYTAGDDSKDIDWKASARSQKMLVRQYIAEKRHNILLVFDTNCRMLAHANENEDKREIAILSAGTLAYLVNKNSDYVSAIYSTEKSIEFYPFKTGLMNIENILTYYHNSVTMTNESDINKSLEYVLSHINRRMIILIVTDLGGIKAMSDSLMKRLMIRNDVLLVQVDDVNVAGTNVYDMSKKTYMSDFFAKDKKLAKLEEEARKKVEEECSEKLSRYKIATSKISCSDDIDKEIVMLMNKHKFEKR